MVIFIQKDGVFVYEIYLYFSHNSLSVSILINLVCARTVRVTETVAIRKPPKSRVNVLNGPRTG